MNNEGLVLYRGLNLNIEDIEKIKKKGDVDERFFWTLKPLVDHHNDSAKVIIEKWIKDASGPYFDRYDKKKTSLRGKPATGSRLGASIFSIGPAQKMSFQVFEIATEIDNIFIDGRDYLYHIVMWIGRMKVIDSEILRKLGAIFGSKFMTYIDELNKIKVSNPHVIEKISTDRLVDYICHDREVIFEHYQNKSILIEGRYSTKFFSCFAIIGGVPQDAIKRIWPTYSSRSLNSYTGGFINRKTNTNDLKQFHDFNEVVNYRDFR